MVMEGYFLTLNHVFEFTRNWAEQIFLMRVEMKHVQHSYATLVQQHRRVFVLRYFHHQILCIF